MGIEYNGMFFVCEYCGAKEREIGLATQHRCDLDIWVGELRRSIPDLEELLAILEGGDEDDDWNDGLAHV